MKNKKILGNIILIFVAAIWGTAFVFQRVGMDSIEPMTFNAARMTLAAIAIGMVTMFRRRRSTPDKTGEKERGKKTIIIGGICCGAFLAQGSLFQQMGLVYTTAGKAGFITALYILIVPVIGFLVFRKKNSWLVWMSVLLGVAGMYLLCINEGFSFSRGDILICICAVMFSGHILCCDYFAERGDPILISAIQFAAAALISWVAAFVLEAPSVDKLESAVIPVLYCGVVSGGIGYTLQMVAQKHTEPATASLLMSLESVFAVLTGSIFLGEQMSLRETVGCIIMFAAIILVQLPGMPGKKKGTGNIENEGSCQINGEGKTIE